MNKRKKFLPQSCKVSRWKQQIFKRNISKENKNIFSKNNYISSPRAYLVNACVISNFKIFKNVNVQVKFANVSERLIITELKL